MQFWHIFAKHGEVNKVLTKQNVMFLSEKDVVKEKILQQEQTFLTSLKESTVINESFENGNFKDGNNVTITVPSDNSPGPEEFYERAGDGDVQTDGV